MTLPGLPPVRFCRWLHACARTLPRDIRAAYEVLSTPLIRGGAGW